MQKIVITFILCLTFLVSEKTLAQIFPIPSYGVTVTGNAVFLEKGQTSTEAQRTINIKKQCLGAHSPEGGETPTTVYIFSKDGTSILGPYTLSCGQTISVPIDDREWGVYVDSDMEVMIDVWFTYESDLLSTQQGPGNKAVETKKTPF